ncbi:MAG TPA: hypothetical protein VGJ60_07435 [Chloroflexota bacterium]|jgi:hypothetical protein
MTNVVAFPGAESPVQFPSRSPTAGCQWLSATDPPRRCPRRAFYALEVRELPNQPEVLCALHLDLALQQAVVAPGEMQISPLVIDRSSWLVGRWAWRLKEKRRLLEMLAAVGIEEQRSA